MAERKIKDIIESFIRPENGEEVMTEEAKEKFRQMAQKIDEIVELMGDVQQAQVIETVFCFVLMSLINTNPGDCLTLDRLMAVIKQSHEAKYGLS